MHSPTPGTANVANKPDLRLILLRLNAEDPAHYKLAELQIATPSFHEAEDALRIFRRILRIPSHRARRCRRE